MSQSAAAVHQKRFRYITDRLNSRLDDVEEHLSRNNLPEPKTTLEEKRQQTARFRQLRRDLQGRQRDLDAIGDCGQQLLAQNAAEPRLSAALTAITTRYQGNLARLDDLVRRLETIEADHEVYHSAQEAFRQWCAGAREQLATAAAAADRRPRSRAALERGAAHRQATELRALLDKGSAKLKACQEAAQRVTTGDATEQAGCAMIGEQVRGRKDTKIQCRIFPSYIWRAYHDCVKYFHMFAILTLKHAIKI